MDAVIQVRPVGQPQRDLLVGMYDQFDPLGAALGLPPPNAQARHAWIDAALRQQVNLAAITPEGEAVGHCFLVAGEGASAEMAVFVHQHFRRRGLGSALVKAALERGRDAGLRRVWTLTASDNIAALRLQFRCGFRVANSTASETEMEIELPPAAWRSDRSRDREGAISVASPPARRSPAGASACP